jgi:hypothetical protein
MFSSGFSLFNSPFGGRNTTAILPVADGKATTNAHPILPNALLFLTLRP